MHIKEQNRLESILDSIQKVDLYTSTFQNGDELSNNDIAFDATMMNFVIIGEMVAKLSEEFKNTYPEIEWHKIKSLRNIAAHDYFGIDAEEVWQIIQNHLPVLKSFIRKRLI